MERGKEETLTFSFPYSFQWTAFEDQLKTVIGSKYSSSFIEISLSVYHTYAIGSALQRKVLILNCTPFYILIPAGLAFSNQNQLFSWSSKEKAVVYAIFIKQGDQDQKTFSIIALYNVLPLE